MSISIISGYLCLLAALSIDHKALGDQDILLDIKSPARIWLDHNTAGNPGPELHLNNSECMNVVGLK